LCRALRTDSVLSLSQSWPESEQLEPIAILAVIGMDQIHAVPALRCINSFLLKIKMLLIFHFGHFLLRFPLGSGPLSIVKTWTCLSGSRGATKNIRGLEHLSDEERLRELQLLGCSAWRREGCGETL